MTSHRIAVLAHDSSAPLLTQWLREAAYRPHLWDAAAPRPVHQHSVLVTHFPAHAATVQTIPPALPLLAPPATWVQLGAMPLEQADALAAQARAAGVRYVHAPYIQHPGTSDDRPICVAFCYADDPAAALIRAVSGHVRWAGPLESRRTPSASDLAGLAELLTTNDEETPS